MNKDAKESILTNDGPDQKGLIYILRGRTEFVDVKGIKHLTTISGCLINVNVIHSTYEEDYT